MQIKDFYVPGMEGLYSYCMDSLRSIDVDVESDYLLLKALFDSGYVHNL